MPLTNFICPDGVEIPTKTCLAADGCRMKERCMARPLLKMMSQVREWKGVASTTQLLKGTMEAFLSIIMDFATSPDKMAFMLLGTGVHKAAEEHGDETSEAELDLSDDEGSIRPDLVEHENGSHELIDYKVCGSFMITKALGIYKEDQVVLDPLTKKPVLVKSGPNKGKEKTKQVIKVNPALANTSDWNMQLNNYRIGVEKKLGIKISRLRVQAIVRDGGTMIALGRGVLKNTYYIDIPIMPDDQVKEYFARKKKLLLDALKAYKEKNTMYTVPCTEDERWNDNKCQNYCAVNKFCPYYQAHYMKDLTVEDLDTVEDEEVGNDGLPKEASK